MKPTKRFNMRQFLEESRSPEGKGGLVVRMAKEQTGELYVYSPIGDSYWDGVSPAAVAKALNEMKASGAKRLNVYINSPGGDVFDGVAIFNLIDRFEGKKTTYVDGLAASAASIIALAGDKMVMAKNAQYMIHEAWMIALGGAADLRAAADVLEKINDTMADTYVANSNQDLKAVKKLMADETWMTAAEAKEMGFADEVTDEEAAEPAAHSMLANYKNTPPKLRAAATRSSQLVSEMRMGVLEMRRRASP